MELTGQELEQLKEALSKAYNTETFEDMLRTKLNKDIQNITSDRQNFPTIIFKTITDAEKKGWLLELIEAATNYNPGAETLQNVASTLLGRYGQPNNQNTENNRYLYIDICKSKTGSKKSDKRYYCSAWLSDKEGFVKKIYPYKEEQEAVTIQHIKRDLLSKIFDLVENQIKENNQLPFPKVASLIKNTIVEVFLDDELLEEKVEEWVIIEKTPTESKEVKISKKHKVAIRSRRALAPKNYFLSTISKWNDKWTKVENLIKETTQNQKISFKDEAKDDAYGLKDFLDSKIQSYITEGTNIIALSYPENSLQKDTYLTCYKFTNAKEICTFLESDDIVFCILISNQAKSKTGQCLSQVVSAGIPIALCLREKVDEYLIKLMNLLFTEQQALLDCLPNTILQHRQKCHLENYIYKDVEHTSLLWDSADRYPTKVKDEKGNLIEHQMNSPI